MPAATFTATAGSATVATPAATFTATANGLAVATPSATITAAPAFTGTPVPVIGTGGLAVTFVNPHYNCQQVPWVYTGDDGQPHAIWGYRASR